jgi:hypothetical protein
LGRGGGRGGPSGSARPGPCGGGPLGGTLHATRNACGALVYFFIIYLASMKRCSQSARESTRSLERDPSPNVWHCGLGGTGEQARSSAALAASCRGLCTTARMQERRGDESGQSEPTGRKQSPILFVRQVTCQVSPPLSPSRVSTCASRAMASL